MESTFKVWETNRHIHLSFLEKYTLEQLNKTPQGFSNNLIWNIGHVVVIQQRLFYASSNLPLSIPDALVEAYKSGTKPSLNDTQETVDLLKELLISPITKTKQDFADGIFKTYREFTTSTGFHIASTQDAIEFNNYHEALHLGFMMNIRKFV